ncbi:MAG: response regulator [Myxococcales bacterium]|nr:response regulator [Myxococcales bacterium]
MVVTESLQGSQGGGGRRPSLSARLLGFARNLQSATTFGQLLDVVQRELWEALGYEHAWMFVSDREPVQTLRLLAATGANTQDVWEHAPVLTVAGDAMLEEMLSTDHPQVIEDARTDARTQKPGGRALDSRTIVNVPLRLLDKPFGALGTGTFGEEGPRVPGPEQLDHLIGMAGQISVAASRILYVDGLARAAREKQELERRLMQAQRLESVGMLAGGIAHDFNNLLTVVLSSASLAKMKMEPDVMPEVESVLAAAERGRGLTRQLLAMSHTQRLSLAPIDLNSRLTQLLELLKRVLPESIALDFVRAERLPLVEGDESQLDQVFMNLCVNARDAMPEGGRLRLETEAVVINGRYARIHPWAKAGRFVLVTVCDSGVGMAPEVVERVFEPFFSTKKERAGTGLGLAVAYGIVRQHGGMIQCASTLGAGTTFKVYLPTLERPVSWVKAEAKKAVPMGGERVLVAEDDAAVRDVAVRILESGGYRVVATESGEAACAAAAIEPFDMVLLDVVMPGLTCAETIERLRTLRPELRFLLASGYTAETNVVALLRDDVHAFLRKPYDPEGLLRAVRRVLDGPAHARLPPS